MTIKGSYIALLMEKRKTRSPSFHLEEFVYVINKAIQEYGNRRYNAFAKDQQLSDDLSALTVDSTFTVNASSTAGTFAGSPTATPIIKGVKYGSEYLKFSLPDNYWHMLGTNVTSVSKIPVGCVPAGQVTTLVAKRLTANQANGIINNAYLKPASSRPYHSFTEGSANTSGDLYVFVGSSLESAVTSVSFDYLKKPEVVSMTVAESESPLDNTAPLEFPEYVCAEIIKIAVMLLAENTSNPRTGTYMGVNTSIPQ